jgi:ABC-type transport system substrate-binding protein
LPKSELWSLAFLGPSARQAQSLGPPDHPITYKETKSTPHRNMPPEGFKYISEKLKNMLVYTEFQGLHYNPTHYIPNPMQTHYNFIFNDIRIRKAISYNMTGPICRDTRRDPYILQTNEM